MEEALCPICNERMPFWERHPLRICGTCASTTKDTDGCSVTFRNLDWMGGFVSVHTIDRGIAMRHDHICYVNGIKCYADESRFGGIVIEVWSKN